MPSIINILESIIKINMEFKLDITLFLGLGPVFIEPVSKRILQLKFYLIFYKLSKCSLCLPEHRDDYLHHFIVVLVPHRCTQEHFDGFFCTEEHIKYLWSHFMLRSPKKSLVFHSLTDLKFSDIVFGRIWWDPFETRLYCRLILFAGILLSLSNFRCLMFLRYMWKYSGLFLRWNI